MHLCSMFLPNSFGMTHIVMAFTPSYSTKHNLLFLKCTFFCLTAKLFHEFQWERSHNPLLQGITNNCSLITVSTSDLTQSLLSTDFQADKIQVFFSECHCYMIEMSHILRSTCSFIQSPLPVLQCTVCSIHALGANDVHQVFCFALW